jgi:hypothetical protein
LPLQPRVTTTLSPGLHSNNSLAYVASLGGWENTEILNKCYGGIPEHIKAQIAKSIHVKFDTLNLNMSMTAPNQQTPYAIKFS